MVEAVACDVVFFLTRPTLAGSVGPIGDYLFTSEFAASHPGLVSRVVRFSDPTTTITAADGGCVVFQEACGAVDLARSRSFVYFPASFEPEDISLHPVRTQDPDGYGFHRQWRVVAEYIEHALGRFGPCINDPARARQGCNKLLQVRAAREAGIDLPDTLVSNDAANIAAFVARGAAIQKYVSEGPPTATGRRSRTAPVTPDDLDAPAELALAPSIYQTQLRGAEEVRFYIIADDVVAVGIRRRDESGDPDVRYQGLVPGDYTLTDAHRAFYPALRRFARNLGLVYAVVDGFPVDGRLYVLELNVNGTWQWLPGDISRLITTKFHGLVHRAATTGAVL